MDTQLIYKNYEDCGLSYACELVIPDIGWLLNNQTNREIHYRNRLVQNEEMFGLYIKVQLAGEENQELKVYYMIDQSFFQIFKLKINSVSVFNKEKWLPKKKWQLIATELKEKIIEANPNKMVLYFELIIRDSVINDSTDKAVMLPYPKEEYDTDCTDTYKNEVASLLMSNDHSDITIKTVNDDEFPAHKCLLAARSAVFKAHFEHNTKETITNIIESTFESKVIQNVLTHIYIDDSPDIEEIPQKLFEAAHFYQLHKLQKQCEKVLKKQLTFKNAIETLELADLYRAVSLKRYTLEFITNDEVYRNITSTKGWKSVQSAELIKSIYEFVMMTK